MACVGGLQVPSQSSCALYRGRAPFELLLKVQGLDRLECSGLFLLLKVLRLDRREHLASMELGVWDAIRAGFGRFSARIGRFCVNGASFGRFPARIERFRLRGASFGRFSAREGG